MNKSELGLGDRLDVDVGVPDAMIDGDGLGVWNGVSVAAVVAKISFV
jgi:hypothetical protein